MKPGQGDKGGKNHKHCRENQIPVIETQARGQQESTHHDQTASFAA